MIAMKKRRGKTPSPVRRQVGTVLSLVVVGLASIGGSYQLGLVIGQNWAVIIAGWALVAIGVLVRILAATDLKSTVRIEGLVTSGIYGRTRNPIYLAFFLIVIGATLASGAILALGWVVISGAAFDWLAKCEEKDLEKAFGEAYLNYKQAVPRFWPRIGR